jgi:3'-phosphoadenosine 5'-phosphosulfate sulfotransferase (PAPS reductase)/FAD synthetase
MLITLVTIKSPAVVFSTKQTRTKSRVLVYLYRKKFRAPIYDLHGHCTIHITITYRRRSNEKMRGEKRGARVCQGCQSVGQTT